MLRSLPFGRVVFKKDTGKVKIKSEDIEKDIFAFLSAKGHKPLFVARAYAAYIFRTGACRRNGCLAYGAYRESDGHRDVL